MQKRFLPIYRHVSSIHLLYPISFHLHICTAIYHYILRYLYLIVSQYLALQQLLARAMQASLRHGRSAIKNLSISMSVARPMMIHCILYHLVTCSDSIWLDTLVWSYLQELVFGLLEIHLNPATRFKTWFCPISQQHQTIVSVVF